MESKGKTRITPSGRSEGDGMENTKFTEPLSLNKGWSASQSSSQSYFQKHFVPPSGKEKGAKFVPYEPYQAAVSPIVRNPLEKECDPFSKQQEVLIIDSQRVSSLASSIIKMYSSMEKGNEKEKDKQREDSLECKPECSRRVQSLEEKVAALEKENKELSSQYQVQAEVNVDLKKMLVASLGEDVQVRVRLMTEDKAALGKEVLRLTHLLEEAQEEGERRAAECGVWESKFRASSLMVKELASWKSTLSQLVNQSASSLDALMKEHDNMFQMISIAYSYLESCLLATVSSSKVNAKKNSQPRTISQLASELEILSNKVQARFLGNLHCQIKPNCKRKLTKDETLANQFLKSFEQLGTGLASRTKGSISPQTVSHVCAMDASTNFCKHCSGEVKLL